MRERERERERERVSEWMWEWERDRRERREERLERERKIVSSKKDWMRGEKLRNLIESTIPGCEVSLFAVVEWLYGPRWKSEIEAVECNLQCPKWQPKMFNILLTIFLYYTRHWF